MQKFKAKQNLLILSLIAFIATLFNYSFGFSDHQEHLALLFRTQDENYLPLDHFLNANSEGYDPRKYSSLLVLSLYKILPLPLIFFLLCYLANWLISWASFHISNYFFPSIHSGIVLAAALVMSVRTIQWGSTSELSVEYFTPNGLGFALALASLVHILKKRWVLAGFILGITSLIHPLVGPEAGVIFFGISGLLLIAQRPFRKKLFLKYLSGGLLFMGIAAIHLLPYFASQGDKIEDELFLQIYAYFRAPHHIIPSYFKTLDTPLLWFYISASAILLYLIWWHYETKNRKAQYFVAWLWLGLLLLAAMGYIFVEIYPIRLVVTAQTFRLLYFFKWSLLILLAGIISLLMRNGDGREKSFAIAFLISSMSFQTLFLSLLLFIMSTKIHKRFTTAQWLIFIELGLLIFLSIWGIINSFSNSNKLADFYLWAAMLILVPGVQFLPKLRSWQVPLMSLATIIFFIYWVNTPRQSDMPIWQQAISRQYNFNDIQSPLAEVARKAKVLTPKDALLITPPSSSEVRYLAERAIVVDFKTYPFKGQAMKEWRQRLLDVYGWTEKKGFDAVQWAYMPHYRVIKTEKLIEIQQKYGATHAILYKETETDFPVLFENEEYKLIYLDKNLSK